ncbi:fumarylacetoacetate hydrolase family protein [Oleispirillum naphthae]|uniref:fumarylacetoacetate hydrolase family protein n=1 Tax=Oleispirillum naphthae TaxID=2838853 RepID=UPI0030826625
MRSLHPTFSTPFVAVDGGGVFPVHRIYCVGRNYADHALEMGGDPSREAPFFFSKPADAVIQGHAVPYPPKTADLHHEVELVLALGTGGSDLSLEEADAAIYGYAVGVDLTRRDLQAEAKSKGRPWDMAKGFDCSGPIGRIIVRSGDGPAPHSRIRLSIDGTEKQSGTLAQMIWSPAEIVANLSSYVELKPGDLIFSGTPAGVGPLARGQKVTAEIDGLPRLIFTIK